MKDATRIMKDTIDDALFQLRKYRNDVFGHNASLKDVGRLGIPCSTKKFVVLKENREEFERMAKTRGLAVEFSTNLLYFKYDEV